MDGQVREKLSTRLPISLDRKFTAWWRYSGTLRKLGQPICGSTARQPLAFFFPPSILFPLILKGLLCTVLLGCKPRDSHQEPRSRLVKSCACLSSATVEHVPERAMSGGGCECAGVAVFVRVPVQVQIQTDTGTGTEARGHRDEGREWTVTGVGSQKQMVNEMSMSICKSWCGYGGF